VNQLAERKAPRASAMPARTVDSHGWRIVKEPERDSFARNHRDTGRIRRVHELTSIVIGPNEGPSTCIAFRRAANGRVTTFRRDGFPAVAREWRRLASQELKSLAEANRNCHSLSNVGRAARRNLRRRRIDIHEVRLPLAIETGEIRVISENTGPPMARYSRPLQNNPEISRCQRVSREEFEFFSRVGKRRRRLLKIACNAESEGQLGTSAANFAHASGRSAGTILKTTLIDTDSKNGCAKVSRFPYDTNCVVRRICPRKIPCPLDSPR
jgi:hypothetical protein